MAPNALTPGSALTPDNFMSPLALTTCATDPPQWNWIFKGACTHFTLKPTGGKFTLQTYQNISVTGSIGYNTGKGATVYLADAKANGDVIPYKGKSFPKYKARGTVVLYAVADNQTTQAIQPLAHKGVPVIQYVLTDQKGFPGKTCSAAIYSNGGWTALPSSFPVKGHTVTISQYTAPKGLELPPKGTGLYFAINCY